MSWVPVEVIRNSDIDSCIYCRADSQNMKICILWADELWIVQDATLFFAKSLPF